MMLFLSIVFAVVPIITYLIILWWLDKYDREPIKLLLIHFLWGMIGAIFISGFFSLIINQVLGFMIVNEDTKEFFATVFTAPVIEEASKGLFLILTISKKKFDNLTDGIVYGGSIGLGFGLTENFLYFFFSNNNIKDLLTLAIVRNIFSVSVHFISTATFGCLLALSKFKSLNRKILYMFIGYLIAVFVHSLWNFMVTFSWTFAFGLIFIVVALIIIFGLIQISLSFEKNIIFYEMNDEILNGRLKPNFASIIPSYKLRNTKGWIKENLRKDYINLATTLAFRKNQLRNITSEKLKNSYINEIEDIRNKLRQIELEAEDLIYSD